MNANIMRTGCSLLLALWAMTLTTWADVLIGTNGDRFTGKVVKETPESVEFDSELGGILIVPRSRIRELLRSAQTASDQGLQSTNSLPAAVSVPLNPSSSSSKSPPSTNSWLPPGVGTDGADWIQLKSGEWLRGQLEYIQERKVSFDSDELEQLTLNLKDVRQVYPAKPFLAQFYGHPQVYGKVAISNEVVQVSGFEKVTLPRDRLTGVTQGGNRELDLWSIKASLGLTLDAGNSSQLTETASAELSRRTPATVGQLNYLGAFSEVDGKQSANNHRLTGLYDIRLTQHWFVRPAYLDYYLDRLANVDYQATLGVGLGYYIFDRDTIEWKVALGPGYQRTKFESVEPGETRIESTPAVVFQTGFRADITRRLTFIDTFSATLANETTAQYSHHSVTTLEFEVKHHLDLDVSLVWDYLEKTQTESNGEVPKASDIRLTLGVGVKF
jgi:putative salt-induced outer membrane protein YdiY